MCLLKNYILVFSFALISFVLSASDFTIVIDPGHGGKDVGALGRKVREKDVNLAVALKLGDMISSNMKDVNVVFTRNTDKYLTLQERAQIANKSKGNLFISIHCNSLDKRNKKRKTIKGASTYTLGLHKSDDNLEVAMRENAVIALEKDYDVTYQGFDPNSSESYIIFEISQNVHMEQSVDFASKVQREFSKTAGRVDRGVRQAGFLVLARTSMPAVLVELDFICNPTVESFLGSKSGQEKLAKSLYNAFYAYKKASDNKIASVSAEKLNDKAETIVEDRNEKNDEQIIYKVQFLTSVKKIKVNDADFKGLKPVDYYKEDGVYKYTYGVADTMEEAQELLKQVRKKFKEAFIIKFSNNKRIK